MIMRNLFVLILLLLTTAVRAQDEESGKQRWERLTPADRQRVLKNYAEWKKLSKEQREEMLRRHRELAEIRKEANANGEQRPDSAERVRKLLESRRHDLLGGAGQSRDRLDEIDILDLEMVARQKAADRLRKLAKRGIVEPQEVERLLALEPRELGKEMRRINQLAFLRDPPPPFLALPEAERTRLAALPPGEFFKAVHEVIPPPPKDGPGWLDRFAPPPEQDGPPLFDPRFHFVKQWLDRNLSPEELDRVRESDPIERRKVVMKLLLGRARSALEARGENKKETLDSLDGLPRGEREIRLIQIIDPAASPPPPPPERLRDAIQRRFKQPRPTKPNR